MTEPRRAASSATTCAPRTGNLEARLTIAVRDMVLRSPRLTEFVGGTAALQRGLDAIEKVWLDHNGLRVHCDSHRSPCPKATGVFQPGAGAHAHLYFLLGGLLARRGYHVLAIDRLGHGLSDGLRGDCTVEEAIAISGPVIDHARSEFGLRVVLMGSSMGGILTIFALLKGLQPDFGVAHNFVSPGKLFSMRPRAKWIQRYRARPYPLSELGRGLETLSADPAISEYLSSRSDPGAAWGTERAQRSQPLRLLSFSACERARNPRPHRNSRQGDSGVGSLLLVGVWVATVRGLGTAKSGASPLSRPLGCLGPRSDGLAGETPTCRTRRHGLTGGAANRRGAVLCPGHHSGRRLLDRSRTATEKRFRERVSDHGTHGRCGQASVAGRGNRAC